MPEPKETRATQTTSGSERLLQQLQMPAIAFERQQRICFANDLGQALLQPAFRNVGHTLPLDALADPALQQHFRQVFLNRGNAHDSDRDEFTWKFRGVLHLVHIQPSGDRRLALFVPIAGNPEERGVEEPAPLHPSLTAALTGMGSWTWEHQTRQLLPDPKLSAKLGPDVESDQSSTNILDHVHADDLPALIQAFESALSPTGEHDAEIETEFRYSADGRRTIWLELRGGPVRDSAGRTVTCSGVCFDVTERKNIEQSTLHAKQALDHANHAKDVFLARVSHEIRTPLTSIIGYAELLSERSQDGPDSEDIRQILDSSRHLQRLVDDLLDLSRVIAGKITIELEQLDLRRLAQDLMSSMQVQAAESGLEFSVQLAKKVPHFIHTDPTRVRQVLTNLIGNALKFTRQGKVSVRIRSEDIDGERFLAFDVDDTGPGIATEKLDELFKPFAQASGSDATRKGGIGLGLAISQRITEVLGGTIRVRTEPGQGSCFTLLIPHQLAHYSPGALDANRTRLEDREGAAELELRGKILVVDDVGSILSLIRKNLDDNGLQLVTARDGLEALNAVEQATRSHQAFDLILLDLHMPHLGGHETLREIRNTGCETPVVALSASAMKGERDRCIGWGFDEFLGKPFRAPELRKLVARFLHAGITDLPKTTGTPPDTKTLLLVEDYEALAKITAKQLERLGFVVETASTATAAIDRARALHPYALVIDLGLPDMDGITLCKTLRQEAQLADRPIIGYTGIEDRAHHEQARAAGFTEVLLKPADLDAFAEILGGPDR